MLAALLIMLVLLAAPADPDVTNQQGRAGKGKSQEQINSEGKAACSTPKGCCNFMQTFASCYCSEWWDGLVKTGNTDAINFHRVTLAACGIPFKGFGC
ncbi:hypothetical protein OEZ86_001130 [Tetradesmus obliquus]|nr:hypothetical protein OEZ86_001130 [Tetradesmus obliquus]